MSVWPSKLNERQSAATRKAYCKPKLQIYGNLTTMTQAMDGMGNADGGGGTGSDMNRTS